MSSAIVAVLGLAAFVGMIVCAKNKEKPQAKLVSILCMAVLVVCIAMWMRDQGAFGDDKATRDQIASYEQYERSMAKAIGDYVNQKFPDEKVIIVAPGGTNFEQNIQTLKLAAFLKEYVKTSGGVEMKGLDYTFDPSNPTAGGPMAGVNGENYNNFFKENSDTNIFILAENLPFNPAELFRLSIFKEKTPKQKVIVTSGNIMMLGALIKKGYIVAATATKPGLTEADYEKLAPKDLDKAFNERYLLITPENLEKVAAENKGLFR